MIFPWLWFYIALFTFCVVGAALLTLQLELNRKAKSTLAELYKSKFFSSLVTRRDSMELLVATSAQLLKGVAIVSAVLFITQVPLFALGCAIVTLVLFGFYLFLVELIPYWIAHAYTSACKGACRGLGQFFISITLPFALPILYLKELGERRTKADTHLAEMHDLVIALLKKQQGLGQLDSLDLKLLESVIQFKDLIVKEIMVPRVHLFSLPIDTSIRTAAKLLMKEGYSRIPIYRDSLDNIVGLLLYKDMLEIYMATEADPSKNNLLDQSIGTLMKGVFYTPETKKVSHLLQEFRTKQKHMAIVVDEYGGTEGIVTIEDILEELVGEIGDEYDVGEENLYVPDSKGIGWIVDAHMNLKDAEDVFGIEIPKEGDYDTLAGFIFYRQEMIPTKGTKISEESFEIEILSASDRSVEKIRLIPKRNVSVRPHNY